MALAVNNCQAKFNKTVKKACERKVIVGNYSGYFFSMPYPTVAFQTRTPEMLDSDAVDYQVSPFSYFLWHRCSGGSGLIRSPFETYALHNKVAVLEADNRTHQATTRSGNTCKTAEDSLGQMAREFCNALTKGSTLWYYDFNIFWYDYPEYYEFFPKLPKIWQEEKPDLVIAFIGKMNLYAMLSAGKLGIPVILSVRSDPAREYPSGFQKKLAEKLPPVARLMVTYEE